MRPQDSLGRPRDLVQGGCWWGGGGSLISGSLGEGPGLRRKPGHLSSSQGIRPLEELLIYRKLPVLGDLPSVGRFGSVCSSFVELGHIEERNL